MREVKAQIIEWAFANSSYTQFHDCNIELVDENGEKPLDDASSNYYKLVSYNSLDLQSEQHTINSLATEIGDMVVEKSADAAASVF